MQNSICIVPVMCLDKRELPPQPGKHKRAKVCVYIKKNEDIKVDVLKNGGGIC